MAELISIKWEGVAIISRIDGVLKEYKSVNSIDQEFSIAAI